MDQEAEAKSEAKQSTLFWKTFFGNLKVIFSLNTFTLMFYTEPVGSVAEAAQ